MKIKLNKGRKSVNISILDNMVIDTLNGSDVKGLSHDYIKKQIANGIKKNSPKDIHNKKIVIIVPDNTRLWARGDIFVPVIIQTLLKLNVPEKSIKIILALGTHSGLDKSKFLPLVGKYCINKIEIINSANKNVQRLVHLGKTNKKTDLYITKEAYDADHIIIFGGILHHLIAGFGGGRKYILPGIAGYSSIQQNHSLAILKDGTPHPNVKQAQLLKNPVNEDMEDAATIFLKGKTSIYAAVAANGTGDIFYTETGSIKETFIKGCKQLNHACCVKISQKGDFALISAGGHRTDKLLYQATKALFNAVNSVKEGGKILFVAGAQEGIGNKIFEDVLMKYKKCPEKIGKKLISEFNMPSYIAFRLIDLLERFDITLVSTLSETLTHEIGFKYSDKMDDYIKNLKGKGYIIPYAENILPVMDTPKHKDIVNRSKS